MSIPRNEDPLGLWLTAFRDRTALDPGRYLLDQSTIQVIQRVVNEYLEARRIANTPGTRTAPAINRKNNTRYVAMEFCRMIYGQLQRNMGISDADKLALGITPLHTLRRRRHCPLVSPALSIVGSTPGAITLEYRSSVNITSRAKPFGAIACQLFVVVSDRNASTMEGARFVGNYTTNPMGAIFDMSERGKQATFFARWAGRRNEFGQWSLPVAMTIAA